MTLKGVILEIHVKNISTLELIKQRWNLSTQRNISYNLSCVPNLYLSTVRGFIYALEKKVLGTLAWSIESRSEIANFRRRDFGALSFSIKRLFHACLMDAWLWIDARWSSRDWYPDSLARADWSLVSIASAQDTIGYGRTVKGTREGEREREREKEMQVHNIYYSRVYSADLEMQIFRRAGNSKSSEEPRAVGANDDR